MIEEIFIVVFFVRVVGVFDFCFVIDFRNKF